MITRRKNQNLWKCNPEEQHKYTVDDNQTISHGHAAEIMGIRKSELIDLYDKLGYSYFDMTLDDLDEELNTFRQLKKKEEVV